ncbi:MAG: HEAT repeat domain-containing protein [Spirochaetales bacterium]|nr:HEAT repeat domain-containing protein [Spirochaetales bacterium]
MKIAKKPAFLLAGILFPVLAVLVLPAFPAWGQDTEQSAEDEGWVRPDREALRQELRLGQALAPDLHMKMDILGQIMNKARAGGISPEDKNIMQVLRYLAGEGTLTRMPSRSLSEADFPEARRASCEVLGYIGGKSSREILLAVLKAENTSFVLSQAVISLGKITDEADAELTRAFTSLLERKILSGGGDEPLAAALLSAVDKLAGSKSGIQDEDLFRALMRMLDLPLTRNLRQKTMLLIEKITGF